jgi:hypothetical protein
MKAERKPENVSLKCHYSKDIFKQIEIDVFDVPTEDFLELAKKSDRPIRDLGKSRSIGMQIGNVEITFFEVGK